MLRCLKLLSPPFEKDTFVGGRYALLLLVNGLHAGVFFVLLHEVGAVQAALMKALQSES